MLPTEDEQGQSSDKGGEDRSLHIARKLQRLEKVVSPAASPGFARRQAAPDQFAALQEIEHNGYFREEPPAPMAGERCCW